MSRYKPDKFNFSHMSERVTFLEQNSDGTFIDNITVWAHIFKDGFTRTETDNWFKVMVREQSALESLLTVGNRLRWKKRNLSIFSWADPSYEDRGFMEIMTKQIASLGETPSSSDGDLFKDIVSIYRMNKIETINYGIVSYKYDYNFTIPTSVGIRCNFSTDRNQWLDDKKIDIERDALIVKFSKDAPIQKEDYIESAVHGRFKIDMIIENSDNMLEAYVKRSDTQ